MTRNVHIIMWSLFLWLSISSGIVNIQAQPTLDNPGPLQFGEQLDVSTVDVEGLNQGASGADLVWDFGGLSPVSDHQLTFVTPASTPHASTFSSSSDIAIKFQPVLNVGSFGIDYEFYTQDAFGFSRAGISNIESILVNYSDDQLLVPYPMSYGQSTTDDFQATFMVGDNEVVQVGTVTITADGYGDIILPAGTAHDVLRLRMVREYTETIESLGITFNYTIETYSWYDPTLLYPVFTITTEIVEDSPNPITTAHYMEYNDTGIEENAFATEFTVYPNPIQSASQLSYTLKEAGSVNLTVFNAFGQKMEVLLNENQTPGSYTNKIDAENWAKGYYFAVLTVNGQQIVQKISVQ